MAKHKFIKGAIKHPGRMKNLAKEHGVSTHQEMENDKNKPGGLGAAARLGLRLTGGDLSPHKRTHSSRDRYGAKTVSR